MNKLRPSKVKDVTLSGRLKKQTEQSDAKAHTSEAGLRLNVHACILSCIRVFVTRMDHNPPDSSSPWDYSGKNTGVGFHALLQGIFPTHGSNPSLLHGRQTLADDILGELEAEHIWRDLGLCDQ